MLTINFVNRVTRVGEASVSVRVEGKPADFEWIPFVCFLVNISDDSSRGTTTLLDQPGTMAHNLPCISFFDKSGYRTL